MCLKLCPLSELNKNPNIVIQNNKNVGQVNIGKDRLINFKNI